jgi:hypothetical protein
VTSYDVRELRSARAALLQAVRQIEWALEDGRSSIERELRCMAVRREAGLAFEIADRAVRRFGRRAEEEAA